MYNDQMYGQPVPGPNQPPLHPTMVPPQPPIQPMPQPIPTNQQPQQMPMGGWFSDPMVGAGQQIFVNQVDYYSQTLAASSTGWIDRNLRVFFAVDTNYVLKKLALLLFPFIHRQWLYTPDDQYIEPKYNINAPDLYIPTMAFLTYVLAAGYMLGLQDRFSPEQIGIQASSALACLSIEVCLLMVIFHLSNVKCWYSFLHYVSMCSYKFVTIILSVLISLAFKSQGYYISVLYFTFALGFFLLKSLHVAIQQSPASHHDHYPNSRLGLYIMFGFCLMQPLIIIWLSRHLVPATV